MSDKNIWTKLNFSTFTEESAYDMLIKQAEYLNDATAEVLKMDVEAIDGYLDTDPPKPVAIYILYVIAPILGNFRRKILTVAEGKDKGRFPVDIVCHIDNKKEESISKEDFLDKIEDILTRLPVKMSIENLYKQSKEHADIHKNN